MIVDILLATYNGEKYLEEQLKSIFNQTYKKFKVFIRDDGSTDRTIDILNKYKSIYPEKIQIIQDNKKGLGAKGNFLELLKYSINDYIMFCDQDDVWMKNKIEITLKFIQEKENNKPCLVHTDLKVVDKNLKVISDSMWKYQNINPEIKNTNKLIVQNNVTGCTAMINKKLKKLLEKCNFENAIMHDWIIAIVASIHGQIEYINEQTILYRQHDKNDTGAKKWGIKLLVDKLKKGNIKKRILETQKQCNDLIPFYTISNEIENYKNLKKFKWFYRKWFCLKNGFLKEGILRNIVFLVLI